MGKANNSRYSKNGSSLPFREPGFRSQRSASQARWLRVSYLTSLCPTFPIVVPSSLVSSEDHICESTQEHLERGLAHVVSTNWIGISCYFCFLEEAGYRLDLDRQRWRRGGPGQEGGPDRTKIVKTGEGALTLVFTSLYQPPQHCLQKKKKLLI